VLPFDHQYPEKTIELALDKMVAEGSLRKGNTTVVISSISAGQKIIDVVEMRVV
jgi:hypothetical protein